MARLIMHPSVLDRLKEVRGIQTDEAMAKIGGVTLNTYKSYRDGKNSPSPVFLAEIGVTFGLSIGELAQIIPDVTTQAVA